MKSKRFNIVKNVKVVAIILSLTGTMVGFQNCAKNTGFTSSLGSDTSFSSATNDNSNPDSIAWSVPNINLVLGSSETFDLNQTLPTSVAKNGRFEVDTHGSPLPMGMTLSPTGLLSAGTSLAMSSASGVVFVYTEP